jgi:hypothetical protein
LVHAADRAKAWAIRPLETPLLVQSIQDLQVEVSAVQGEVAALKAASLGGHVLP